MFFFRFSIPRASGPKSLGAAAIVFWEDIFEIPNRRSISDTVIAIARTLARFEKLRRLLHARYQTMSDTRPLEVCYLKERMEEDRKID